MRNETPLRTVKRSLKGMPRPPSVPSAPPAKSEAPVSPASPIPNRVKITWIANIRVENRAMANSDCCKVESASNHSLIGCLPRWCRYPVFPPRVLRTCRSSVGNHTHGDALIQLFAQLWPVAESPACYTLAHTVLYYIRRTGYASCSPQPRFRQDDPYRVHRARSCLTASGSTRGTSTSQMLRPS